MYTYIHVPLAISHSRYHQMFAQDTCIYMHTYTHIYTYIPLIIAHSRYHEMFAQERINVEILLFQAVRKSRYTPHARADWKTYANNTCEHTKMHTYKTCRLVLFRKSRYMPHARADWKTHENTSKHTKLQTNCIHTQLSLVWIQTHARAHIHTYITCMGQIERLLLRKQCI
jgi:hypothetical protein